MYARYHDVAEEQARATLLELLGGSDEEPPIIDATPRIVLVAGDFRPEVTTTVLWLIDNFELDIRCVRLQPFAVAERILVHSEVIIPLPEAEHYRLGMQRKRREVERVTEARSRGRVDYYRSLSSAARCTPARPSTFGVMLCPQTQSRRGARPCRSTRPPL